MLGLSESKGREGAGSLPEVKAKMCFAAWAGNLRWCPSMPSPGSQSCSVLLLWVFCCPGLGLALAVCSPHGRGKSRAPRSLRSPPRTVPTAGISTLNGTEPCVGPRRIEHLCPPVMRML